MASGRKKSRRRHQVKFGDEDFAIYFKSDEEDKASWSEIYRSCCVHPGEEWFWLALAVVFFIACVYLFTFGLLLMGESTQVLFGCQASSLFGVASNPLTALMTSILATVMLQSSSTTLAITTALVEAGAISVSQGIYMVMGANVGTTITSTIVSLSHLGDFSTLERGFSAATIHGMFNCLTVMILFPLELATGYLEVLTSMLVEGAETGDRKEDWKGPVKGWVAPLVNRIIIVNEDAIVSIAEEKQTCDSFYPIDCDAGYDPSYTTCNTGLIGCDKSTNRCPLFFRESATRAQDQASGAICMVLGLIFLFLGMAGIIFVIQKLLFGISVKVVHTVTHCNGYIAIVVGIGLTMLVQSSSIVTSALVPFAAVGALRLEQAFPLIIGSNLGTALQAVLVSLNTYGTDPLQVSLAHLFFNVTGTLIFYPLPFMRRIPIWVAQRLGHGAYLWRWFAVIYILVLFMVIPLFFDALSLCFTEGGTGTAVLGGFLSAGLCLGLVWLFYWCKFRGGDMRYVQWIEQRTGRKVSAGATTAAANGETRDSRYSGTDERGDMAGGTVALELGRVDASSTLEKDTSGQGLEEAKRGQGSGLNFGSEMRSDEVMPENGTILAEEQQEARL